MKPIAIIGIGCRFPGANNPQEFWQLLSKGVDAITEIPNSRWDIDEFYDDNPDTPGKMNVRYGGFVSQVDRFDPDFFGISPREAQKMDPQQRLLLEVAWEALENGGIVREQLAGSKTGVFVGISTNDYSRIYPEYNYQPQGYDLTGNSINIAAGRLSYLLNLRGPSLAVDTACSSSLVAVHLACQSLQNNESTMAIAAGVNLILSPIGSIALTNLKALSPDGRCKTFDENANGYVRSEGSGCVILKPLDRALADGDPIYALIRGSAINHDGRSKGLTVPYGPAQESLIRSALHQAEVTPKEISYVELHGTGTPLGDPIEAMALGEVLKEGRDANNPCLVGAVKSNIGHLEAAAGIASLIKVALSLKYQQIPPSLHFHKPNPYIPFDKLPLKVQSSLIPWTKNKYGAKAGISSFGFSGTNAHVILEEAAPPQASARPTIKFPHLLPLSAHTPAAVQTLALSYQDSIAGRELTPEFGQNLCYSASVRRTHHAYRQAVVINSPEELLTSLQTVADISPDTYPKPSKRKPKVVFVFSGQGPQWWAMGRELLTQEPVFRSIIEQCDTLIQKYGQWSLLKELAVSDMKSRLQDTEIAQPALFALQVGLAHLWRTWGIEPKAVIGHSLGEVAAAYFAGVLSLETAVHLICHRGRLMQQATGNGKMLAIELSATEVEPLLADWVGKLEIAAMNSPTSTVISGQSRAVEAFSQKLEQQHPDIFYKELPVNYAFHSQQMTPFAPALVEELGDLNPEKETISIFSTVTGKKQAGKTFTADYWGQNLRQTVRFAPAIEALIKSGYTVFVEISPHPVLSGYINGCLRKQAIDGVVLPSLNRKQGERATLLTSLGKLYNLGQSVHWERLYPDGCSKVDLPLYPWQRQSYWVNESQSYVPELANSSPLLKLLVAGKTEQLSQELTQHNQLSPEAKQFLPELLQLLIDRERGSRSGSISNHGVDEKSKTNITQDLTGHTSGAIRFGGQPLTNARYQVEWQLSPLNIENKSSKKESWLIFTDSQGVGQKLANTITDPCILVSLGDSDRLLASNYYQIAPNSARDIQKLLQAIDTPVTKIVYLWGLDSSIDSEQSQTKCYGSLLYLVQALAQTKTKAAPQLWIGTKQAQPVTLPCQQINLAQTPLWGMGRVIALEYPQLWGGSIDLGEDNFNPDAIIAEITGQTGEDRVAFWDNNRYVARLLPCSTPLTNPKALNPDGSYLITGGLGNLGLMLAEWLIEKGVRHLILTSRRELSQHSEAKKAKIRALETKGASITVITADVSDYRQMSQVFDRIKFNCPELRGIIHAAGILNDCSIAQIDLDSFATVFEPKVKGAWNLHQLSQDLTLDFFVCFSSISALLGSRGQVHYAAANHFLDGLVYHRQTLGLPALSINWGPWAEGGMATEGYEEGLKRVGIQPLAPQAALEVLGNLLASESRQTMVLDIDWSAFAKIMAAKGKTAFLEALLPKSDRNNKVHELNFRQKLAQTPIHRRQELLTTQLQQEVKQILGHSGTYLPEIDRGFFDMGMDSLMSLELKHRLETLLSVSIPSTLAFECPTIEEVVTYLVREVFAGELEFSATSTIESPATIDQEQTIAGLEGLSAAETEALIEKEIAELEALLN
ncbi:MAG: type I polyketide synthase [Xenococcaceae cyanobacterium]